MPFTPSDSHKVTCRIDTADVFRILVELIKQYNCVTRTFIYRFTAVYSIPNPMITFKNTYKQLLQYF